VRTVTVPPGKKLEDVEETLRNQFDFGESGALRWDNTVIDIDKTAMDGVQRQGRAGPGVPRERPKSRDRKKGRHWNDDPEPKFVERDGTPVMHPAMKPPDRDGLLDMLQASNGNVAQAAKDAGVKVETFRDWMDDFHVAQSVYD
jgi:hypothetical protein